jgi:hypothetical protein
MNTPTLVTVRLPPETTTPLDRPAKAGHYDDRFDSDIMTID